MGLIGLGIKTLFWARSFNNLKVSFPTTPSTWIPSNSWNLFTSNSVCSPKIPSGNTPLSNFWKLATPSPLSVMRKGGVASILGDGVGVSFGFK